MAAFWSIKLIVNSVLAVIPLLLRLFVATGKAIFKGSTWAISATRKAVTDQKKVARASGQPTAIKQTRPKQTTKAKE
jgi:hypothetical protein